jgi:hypothetical protein
MSGGIFLSSFFLSSPHEAKTLTVKAKDMNNIKLFPLIRLSGLAAFA